jgi:hypothetical protein
MKTKPGETVTFELSEHDATIILSLVKKEIGFTAEIWRSYWESLAQTIEQSIIQASMVRHSVWNGNRIGGDEIKPEPSSNH